MMEQEISATTELENLQAYRNARVCGDHLKNLDLINLFYKEVMPDCGCQQEAAPAPQQVNSCGNEMHLQQPSNNCAMDFYANYAMNALSNMSKMEQMPSNSNNCGCQMPAKSEQQPLVQENCSMMETKPAEMDHCMNMKKMTMPMSNNCDADYSQQLNRMEQMLREMYMTNQELFKCVINCCKAYTMK